MKRIGLTLVGLLLIVAVGIYAARKALTLRAMRSVVAANLGTDWVADLPDGLHVALCGAGSPLPDPGRSGPCVAVVAGEAIYLVDVGSGASGVLSQLRIPQGRVDGVLLTHFHSDHIDGLGELLLQRWVNSGSERPTPVHGPQGVEQVVEGFNLAYAADVGYRVAHHGEAIIPPSGAGAEACEFEAPAAGDGLVIVDEGGLQITTFRVEHPPIEPAVGYRFDYAGRSVVVTGDTTKSATVAKLAAGADLLVHEALAPDLVEILEEGAAAAGRERIAKIMHDILDYHTSPVEAAEVAAEAGVGHLLFYHVVPPLLLPPMVELFVEGVDEAWDGPVTVGRDGTVVRMDAGSEAIVVEELL